MATWPANAETDWNTKMLAYLAIEHTTEGYHKYPVNGTPAEVRTKYFTGTTDADSKTDVTHDIDNALTKILHVSGAITNSAADTFLVSTFGDVDAIANRGFSLIFDATKVAFANVATGQQSKSYFVKIDYLV